MKPNIKKLIKIAVGVFSGLMLVSSAVFADDGAEFELYYDFEDYSASLGSGILPDDEYWGLSSATGGTLKQFGSYIEDGNTSMRLLPWAEPVLFFNRIAESGRLHISFDFKTSNPIFDALLLLDDGRTSQDPRYNGHNDLKYARGPRFLTKSGKVSYNAYNATSTDPGGLSVAWNYVPSDVTFNGREWHRFDMITTDLSKSRAHQGLSIPSRSGADGDRGSRCDQPHHEGIVSRHRAQVRYLRQQGGARHAPRHRSGMEPRTAGQRKPHVRL